VLLAVVLTSGGPVKRWSACVLPPRRRDGRSGLGDRVTRIDVLVDALERLSAGDVVIDPEIVSRVSGRRRALAEPFRERGLAVLAYDHRGHGSSDGEPRGEINVWIQALGYIDAVSFARATAEIGTSPIALWGDSLSAMAALGVTALDDRVGALICQVPALGDQLGPEDPEGTHLDAMRRFLGAGAVRRPPGAWVSSAVVSPDQSTSPSALKPLTAFRWFIEYGGRYGTGWTNRVVFATLGDGPDFDPFACAPRVRVPTLFVMSPDDEMPGAVSEVTRAVFDRITGPKEIVEVDGGHFGIIEYPSAAFERASEAQAAWLTRTLGATA
jgi:pimeloyl-ACP methyl ester carboxylesterase